MHKFVKLVQNEVIKLMKKKGTLVMAVLFVAAVIGFTGLCKLMTVLNSNYNWQQEPFQWGEVASNMEYYREQYEKSVVEAEDGSILSCDMELKQEYEYWKFLADKEIRYDDWLYTEGLYSEYCADKFALENGIAGELEEPYSARIAQIEGYMTENGWKLYYQERMAELLAGGEETDREARLWFYQYALEKDIAPGADEISTLLESVLQNKVSLAELAAKKEAGERVSEERIAGLKDEITLGIYRLENGIVRDISSDVKYSSLFETSTFNFWSAFSVCKTLIKIVGVMCIVIAGSIVAEEFSQGTYKFLLMSPAKRWKILVAKFVTVLLFGIVMLAALYLLSLLCCMIFFGTAELTLPMLSIQNGAVVTSSPLVSIMGAYLLSTVEILAMTMLALAISTLVKGNALAISVSLLVFFSGSLIEMILRNFGVDFGRYLLFANLDLPALYAGTEIYAGQTFGFAVAVILCHLVVFGWTAWDAFTRREM